MTLKVGIIGLGVGEAHIKGYENHKDVEVVALCDFNDEKAKQAEKKYLQIKVVKSAEEILSDKNIQIVSIASYDNYHYEQILSAIEYGKHIFVEKPLCLHKKEALAIRSALDKMPHLKISSNLILRKCPRFQKLKEMIDDDYFGDIFHVEGDYNYGRLYKVIDGWRGDLDFYSIICGGGVHIVDLLWWLTNRKVVQVFGYGNRIASKDSKFKHNDSITCVLKYDNEMTAKISVHFGCVHPHHHNLAIYGTDATFYNLKEEGRLFKSRDDKDEYQVMNEEYPGVHKGDLLKDFVDSIVGESSLSVSKEDVFRVMSICFAMEEAVKIGKPVDVQYI